MTGNVDVIALAVVLGLLIAVGVPAVVDPRPWMRRGPGLPSGRPWHERVDNPDAKSVHAEMRVWAFVVAECADMAAVAARLVAEHRAGAQR